VTIVASLSETSSSSSSSGGSGRVFALRFNVTFCESGMSLFVKALPPIERVYHSLAAIDATREPLLFRVHAGIDPRVT